MSKTTDFSRLVRELLEAYGESEVKLAARLGVSQPTVHRLRTGDTKEPAYELGARIVALHKLRPRRRRSA